METPLLSVEEFGLALAKGQGRTILALRHTKEREPYFDAIIEGCLRNRPSNYDYLIKPPGVPYLWSVVAEAGLKERLLGDLLAILFDENKIYNRDRYFGFLDRFIRDGETRAQDALFTLAQRGYGDAQDMLADGSEHGLEWVVENVLPQLKPADHWRIAMWLPDKEDEDATPTQKRLRKMHRQYAEALDASRAKQAEPTFTPREFLARLNQKHLVLRNAQEFAEQADDDLFLEAANLLFTLKHDLSRSRLASVFVYRPFPLPPETLFPYADIEFEGWAVCALLGTFDSPSVRAFALDLIQQEYLPLHAVSALTASFQPGDEEAIAINLDLERLSDPVDFQWFAFDVLNFFKKRPEANWQTHAEWIYEHSPCGDWRAGAFEWMDEHGIVPERIRQEAPYDSESAIRERVAASRLSP